jgi:hypothetical protein
MALFDFLKSPAQTAVERTIDPGRQPDITRPPGSKFPSLDEQLGGYRQGRLQRIAPGEPHPDLPMPELPTAPTVGGDPNFPFGPDRPGESRMFRGSIAPLRNISQLIQQNLGAIPGFGQTTQQVMGIAPQIQGLFQPDAGTQGQLFQNIMGMLRPQQEEQTRALSNQLAAMGMGGGRAGRALAQQQRGFGEQTTDITNQLLQQQLAGQQTAGQVLSNLLGQQLGAGQALQTNLLGMLPGLGIAESQLAPTILDVFQNRGA